MAIGWRCNTCEAALADRRCETCRLRGLPADDVRINVRAKHVTHYASEPSQSPKACSPVELYGADELVRRLLQMLHRYPHLAPPKPRVQAFAEARRQGWRGRGDWTLCLWLLRRPCCGGCGQPAGAHRVGEMLRAKERLDLNVIVNLRQCRINCPDRADSIPPQAERDARLREVWAARLAHEEFRGARFEPDATESHPYLDALPQRRTA